MKKYILLLVSTLVYSACILGQSNTLNINDSAIENNNARNVIIINGMNIGVEKINSGDIVSFRDIVNVPSTKAGNKITIQFPSEYVTNNFISDFFLGCDTQLREIHPFSQEGVEAELYNGSLRLTLHAGVTLYLRNGTLRNKKYLTFHETESKSGVVLDISGNAYRASIISKEENILLDNFYIRWQPSAEYSSKRTTRILSDGSAISNYPSLSSDVLPKKFQPKIVGKYPASENLTGSCNSKK